MRVLPVLLALSVLLFGCVMPSSPARTEVTPGESSIKSRRLEQMPSETRVRVRPRSPFVERVSDLPLTLEQIKAKGLENFEYEYISTDGGWKETTDEGKGVGAGAVAEGDKLDGRFDGTPPKVGKTADGAQTAEGGGVDSTLKGSAVQMPKMPWANPLFWIGVAGVIGCGASVYLGLRRLAMVSGFGGVALIAAAFYPFILLFAVAGVIVIVAWPYAYAEVMKRRAEQKNVQHLEALRAVVAGVEHKDVPENVRNVVKSAIAKEADGRDKDVIEAVKRADKVGKYE